MPEDLPREQKFVLWFDELRNTDVPLVGGKSASLGEMTSQTKVPVPYGFATTAAAYEVFLKKSGLRETIAKILSQLTDPEDSQMLQKVGEELRETVKSADIPPELAEAFRKAYLELAAKYQAQTGTTDLPYVAVRSSATAEDLPDASFAGQQETYLNVLGAEQVIELVKHCYASLFTDRAIYYRVQKGFEHMDVALSAVVQLMVYSKSAGVMFTLNVSNGNRDQVDIEAAYGLGEYVVQGKVSPDNYTVSKSTGQIVDRDVNIQNVQLIRKPEGGVLEVKVSPEDSKSQVLTDDQILELASYARKIEDHYGRHMDIEWGLDERTNQLFILQARPETVWSQMPAPEAAAPAEAGAAAGVATTSERNVIVKGTAASPGMVFGKAMVYPKDELEEQMEKLQAEGKIKEAEQLEKEWKANVLNTFEKDTILVTEMTDPDWVPAMKKALAIVTNSGGKTCHAAIVSREMGIPCIVGTSNKGTRVTDILKNGDMITVDASAGVVYEGVLEEAVKKAEAKAAPATGTVAAEFYQATGTKVYMNLGNPDMAEEYAKLPCDGIGLMREEFIWGTFIGKHPLHLIEIGQANVVVEKLAEGIRTVAQAMSPRPVILRLADFKSSEYRDLEGGEKYEPREPAPLLGWRGASRYYDEKYIEAFKLELEAIKQVRNEYGLTNVHVMIPFCRTVEECRKTVTIMEENGLKRGPDFQIWVMAEIPSNIILADKFNKYVDGYSIGSNDLTMLLMGLDRDSDTIAHIADERNLVVKRAIKHLIEVAHKEGKTVSICGQAPSFYPNFTKFLIKCGIDSVSVNPDTVKATKNLVAAVEQRILLDTATGKGLADDPDLVW
ncbi:MAG: phosphoenolpyruvate synthase [Candidatus Undinarchaeales archaeon]|jgi:pyruvate,water dikinase|nr:phosphoenolpyruvate synthase [Candidatus Undinarchaeales archaeon]MDP7492113.1 phosphoenolpyruvate synthase [Candidatus Undinarchaeales archaeon]